MHASSNNGGTSFGTANTVGGTTNAFGGFNLVHERENAAVNLAADGAGGLHAVWSSFIDGGVNVQGYYSRSADGGVTWSTPAALTALYGATGVLMPTVAAKGSRVSISATAVDVQDSARYVSLVSNNGGTTWGTPEVLSTAPTFFPAYTSGEWFGDYNRSVRTACNTLSIWSDGRNNTGPKVYVARQSHCATGIREVSAVNSAVQLRSIFPNPATTMLSISLRSDKQIEVGASLSDLSGREVSAKKYRLSAGDQTLSFPVQGAATGVYLLTLSGPEGIIASRQVVVGK
jgi:hypothetical protein